MQDSLCHGSESQHSNVVVFGEVSPLWSFRLLISLTLLRRLLHFPLVLRLRYLWSLLIQRRSYSKPRLTSQLLTYQFILSTVLLGNTRTFIVRDISSFSFVVTLTILSLVLSIPLLKSLVSVEKFYKISYNFTLPLLVLSPTHYKQTHIQVTFLSLMITCDYPLNIRWEVFSPLLPTTLCLLYQLQCSIDSYIYETNETFKEKRVPWRSISVVDFYSTPTLHSCKTLSFSLRYHQNDSSLLLFVFFLICIT